MATRKTPPKTKSRPPVEQLALTLPTPATGKTKAAPTLVGTSGYAYAEWKGSFYPSDLSAKKMLPFYADRFGTVESNSTFRQIPEPEQVAAWAPQVPAHFRFAIKASQQITHHRRLKTDAPELTAQLWQATAELGVKEGPTLFQLPPNFKKDAGLLAAFLDALPQRRPDRGVAFEFRHVSWFDDETWRVLSDRNAALCIAEDEGLATPWVTTANWGYLRPRRIDYSDGDLGQLAQKLTAEKWKRAFVYFKHEETGSGPRFAAQLMSYM